MVPLSFCMSYYLSALFIFAAMLILLLDFSIVIGLTVTVVAGAKAHSRKRTPPPAGEIHIVNVIHDKIPAPWLAKVKYWTVCFCISALMILLS